MQPHTRPCCVEGKALPSTHAPMLEAAAGRPQPGSPGPSLQDTSATEAKPFQVKLEEGNPPPQGVFLQLQAVCEGGTFQAQECPPSSPPFFPGVWRPACRELCKPVVEGWRRTPGPKPVA